MALCEHGQNPEGCEICAACSNCGEPQCDGWCDECEDYACEPDCTCNDWDD